MVAIAVASRAFSIVLIALTGSHGHAVWPLLTPDNGLFAAWDGQWYLAIATNGYHAQAIQAQHHDFAFFPAWPILIRVATLGVLSPEIVSVVLANVLFAAGLVMAAKVLARTHGHATALRGAALLAFSPPAFVFSLAYSEALFLAVTAGYFLVALTAKGRPLVLGAGMLTRILGAGLVAAAVAAASRGSAVARRANVAAAVAGLLAIAAWWAFIAVLTKDPLGFLHGALGWQESSGLPALEYVVRSKDAPGLLGYGFAALILAASVAMLRHDRPMAVFAVSAVTIGLVFGRQTSVARYALAAFPAFGVLGGWVGRRGTVVLLLAFMVGQALFVGDAFSVGSANEPP